MSTERIRDLFALNIAREIEEVVKVDQTDAELLQNELSEYIATDSIKRHYLAILERYAETPNKPHEGIAVWVSGFFGSGKSSFAKYLGLGLQARDVLGRGAGELLAERIDEPAATVLLKTINEQIPTHAVIFDVSADRGIRSGNQTLTEIMYRLFLRSLDYAEHLDVSELEIALEGEDRLGEFEAKYAETFDRDWNDEKNLAAFSLQKASQVMHLLEPETFPTADSWRESAKDRADITPTRLAERCIELLDRRRPGYSLAFVIDEVGQFVARDVQKMLDLMGVVQQLGRVGRGRMWIVVTSQEKLTELVGGLDDKRVELARLMDRFPLQVHLEPADISEVTSKRVLTKNAKAEPVLRELFAENRNRLTDNTRLSADIELPELSADNFVELYPLLPYQVDLIISVVSGLRTAGGASKHVGGANRTIIKLAQQLLIRPDVDLADAEVGTVARLDQIFDLVSNNISSEIRAKIDAIPAQVQHPLAQKVAKAIALLQFAQSVHRTSHNIAAVLHEAVDADSRQAEVAAALNELEGALLIRQGDDGYRIPTPSEDDWERQRAAMAPKPTDLSRIYEEVVVKEWQPQPSHSLHDIRSFKAGLFVNERKVVPGDTPFHVSLVEPEELSGRTKEGKQRSQTEPEVLVWVAALSDQIDARATEVFRSREILGRKERGATTKAETGLVAEEKRRQRGHEEELRRMIRDAMLDGTIFFRGNERGPDDTAKEVNKAATHALGVALPDVFHRFSEGGARISRKDLDALTTHEDLEGLTPVFAELGLVRDESGRSVIDDSAPPLAAVFDQIKDRAAYGEKPTGSWMQSKFAAEPFGWDLETVRLLTVSLVRAGKVLATSKGRPIESATSLEARTTFSNNNLFKSAAFEPRVGPRVEFQELVDASQAFESVFGRGAKELEENALAGELKTAVGDAAPKVQTALTALAQANLPGMAVFSSAADEINLIINGSTAQAIRTFNSAHREIKEAIKRAAELEKTLDERALEIIAGARGVLRNQWPFLSAEVDLKDAERSAAETLEDLLARETFFREIGQVERHAETVTKGFRARFEAAAGERSVAYTEAHDELHADPDWPRLDEAQQQEVAATIVARMKAPADDFPIPLLREEVASSRQVLDLAISKLHEIIEGDRLTTISVGSYFAGGIDSEEQLDAAVSGLREAVAELIRAGKKVIVR